MNTAPFFVVGCARSGTTLLRLMLDSHPHLAVPPESHFVVRFADGGSEPVTGVPAIWQRARRWIPRRDPSLDDRLEAILSTPQFANWHIEPSLVREQVLAARPTTYAALVDAVFRTYARSQGKERWGDKTPWYVLHLPLLADLFPRACFVHLVRDGRDVAVSLTERPWGPSTPVGGAFQWRQHVRTGRRAGAVLGPERYLEVRLEDLVRDTEGTLRVVCDFLAADFDRAMLEYVRDAATKVGWVHSGVRHVTSPPTPGLRDWRSGLSREEQEEVEAVCHRELRALGYATEASSPRALARAWRVRARLAMRPQR